jgi:sugar (pentulose or hexulose) kinase
MARSIHLAVDLGAASGRVVAGEFDGNRLAVRELHRFANPGHAVLGSYYWDVLALFAEAKAGLARAAAQYGGSIVSLGVATWGVDYALLDRRGDLLGLPHQYRDPRTAGMEQAAARRMSRARIYDITGIQFVFFNTLLQLLSQVRSRSPALAAAHRLLFTPDLFHYWLSGQAVNEYTIASTSQLLDVRKRAWSRPLLEAMGIPARLFGPIAPPGTVLGELLPGVCEETGLHRLQVVTPASHDTASAVVAVPTRGVDHAYLSSGTWSLMGVEVPRPVLTAAAYRCNFTNEGGVDGTIRLLKNLTGLWLVQECQRTWARAGEEASFVALAKEAAAAPPFRAVIDTDSPDFAAPGDMPSRIRDFCRRTRQPVPESRGEVIRVVFESLALKYRRAFGQLETVAGRRCDTLHVVGGGCREALLNQFVADALQRPVVAGPVEATATGNILVQMIATGRIRSVEQGRDLVRRSVEMAHYEPGPVAPWDAAFERYAKVEGE